MGDSDLLLHPINDCGKRCISFFICYIFFSFPSNMFANVLVCLDIPLSKPPTAPSGENVCQPMEDLGLGQVTSSEPPKACSFSWEMIVTSFQLTSKHSLCLQKTCMYLTVMFYRLSWPVHTSSVPVQVPFSEQPLTVELVATDPSLQKNLHFVP